MGVNDLVGVSEEFSLNHSPYVDVHVICKVQRVHKKEVSLKQILIEGEELVRPRKQK